MYFLPSYQLTINYPELWHIIFCALHWLYVSLMMHNAIDTEEGPGDEARSTSVMAFEAYSLTVHNNSVYSKLSKARMKVWSID